MNNKIRNTAFWLSRKINYPLTAPDVIQVSLTYRCNLKCRMCSIAGLLPKEEELSTGQILEIIDQAASYGIKELLLTGGEPFIREDIFAICSHAHTKGLRSIITTNGLLIDNALAERIAGSDMNHVHFSLDGLLDTHEYYRGKDTFEKTIRAIKFLEEKRRSTGHFSLGIAVTVMRENVTQLYEIVKLADELNVDVVNFQPLIADNANFMERKALPDWLGSESIPVLRQQLERINGASWRHVSVIQEPPPVLLINYYQGTLKRSDWVCFGGFKTVFICYAKQAPLVYSCHGICGDLSKQSLKEAWVSQEAFKLRRHSRHCRKLCMQSCYSRSASGSLMSLLASWSGMEK